MHPFAGSKWRTRRKLITPSFHFKILEDFVEVFNSQSKILMKNLESSPDKENFDVCPLITLFTLDVIIGQFMCRSRSKFISTFLNKICKIYIHSIIIVHS